MNEFNPCFVAVIIARNIAIFCAVFLVFFAKVVFAEEYVKIQILPANVGVFAKVGKQQFQAYGITASNVKVDITKKVDWYITANPFDGTQGDLSGQLPPEKIARINQDGLATVLSTWGRVKVNACYPRGCKIIPEPELTIPMQIPVNLLLLSEKKVEEESVVLVSTVIAPLLLNGKQQNNTARNAMAVGGASGALALAEWYRRRRRLLG